MKVFEIIAKVYLLKDILFEDVQTKIFKFMDTVLARTDETLKFHNSNEYKNYCFNSFYPLEKDGVYKEDSIYTITIRTVNKDLALYFKNKLPNVYTNEIKGLKTEMKIISNRKIEKIYAMTPLIIKNDDGYWKNLISKDEFERRIRENLIKKHNDLKNEKMCEEFKLYSSISFDNNKPIPRKYKGKILLGDKITLEIADDEVSQEIAYMALGTGIGEMNARGFGFLGYRWKR